CRCGGDSGNRHNFLFRRLAAAVFRERCARARARAVVAEVLGPLPVLLRTAFGASAAASLHRFRQGIRGAGRDGRPAAQAVPFIPRAEKESVHVKSFSAALRTWALSLVGCAVAT